MKDERLLSDHIDIRVKTSYLAEQSDPETHRYVFTYQITITNNNAVPVKLLGRKWVITDGNEQTQEVVGEGVVGEQPEIAPSKSYTYTSGTVLTTEVGSMLGYYRMQTPEGIKFNAPIFPFTLALPNALH